MNKIKGKNILIESVSSFDKINKTKSKQVHIKININDFLQDYFEEQDTNDFSKYIKR